MSILNQRFPNSATQLCDISSGNSTFTPFTGVILGTYFG